MDVSSQSLDVRIGRDGASGSFSNTGEGIQYLAEFVRKHGVEMVVMEASGGYEQLPFGMLSAEGLGVAIVNARSVRKFAEAMGILEKTDQIDAGVIAWFGETKRVSPMQPASPEQSHLRALVTYLRQLTESRAMQRNQRLLVTDKTVRTMSDRIIALLNRQILKLETEIAALIGADPLWQQLDESFRTIKGVADRTVSRLMAELPEIGILSNKKISKLVGLAPLADDSGKSKGKRKIYGGRQSIRSILYFIAGGVGRFNPDFSAFKARLEKAGKPKRVVRTALAHKLLIRLNAKARDVRQSYQLALVGCS